MIDFNPEKIYSFEELPEQVKQDCIIQFPEFEECTPKDCDYIFELISYEQLLEELDNLLGPSLIEELEEDYVLKLTEDIRSNGLLYPPIGSEGIHRSLA